MAIPSSKENIQITLYIKRTTLAKAKRLAKKAGVPRNRILANVCEVGVDELMMYDTVGVLTLARVINEWKEDRTQGRLALRYNEA